MSEIDLCHPTLSSPFTISFVQSHPISLDSMGTQIALLIALAHPTFLLASHYMPKPPLSDLSSWYPHYKLVLSLKTTPNKHHHSFFPSLLLSFYQLLLLLLPSFFNNTQVLLTCIEFPNSRLLSITFLFTDYWHTLTQLV